MAIESIDPRDESVLATYIPHDAKQVDEILSRVAARHPAWATTSFAERAAHMQETARLLEARKARYGEWMAREMGKPIGAAHSEIEKCAWACRYYAEHAERFLADEPVDTDAKRSGVVHRPLGTVLAVMPWNFPFWQVFRFLAPALMAGNTGLLKHASNVFGSALAIEEVVRDAGFPEDVFRTLLIGGSAVADVIADRRVAAVTLTGSTAAGRSVGGRAGECLKPSVLELGGSDAYVVLADADLDRAVAACSASRMINNGQSCIAAKRFIVEAPVYDRFVAGMAEALRAYVPGDPLDPAVKLGPMARVDLRDELHDQVRRSVDAGARLVLGGEMPDRKGAWYPATLLADVTPGMAAFDEETFGPVAAVTRAADEDEAIALANRSVFGLGAAVFTRDEAKGWAIAADRLEAGCCFVNDLVRSDPRLPFGGIKESGYGRELGPFGIREFVNSKSVWQA